MRRFFTLRPAPGEGHSSSEIPFCSPCASECGYRPEDSAVREIETSRIGPKRDSTDACGGPDAERDEQQQEDLIERQLHRDQNAAEHGSAHRTDASDS